ncbi:hypothetical protein DL93DRAFT_2072770 [Clavulina sp. PMI_390]|nr:hypothetical protein DL93DRAFT_2072770 [Clavulina sp. PMI_390]
MAEANFLTNCLQRQKSLLSRPSPLATLPDELLLLVFENTIEDDRNDPNKRLSGLKTLTSVSSLWRNVMLAAASMWTHVSVLEFLDLENDDVWGRTHGRIQAFLERSNLAPLNVNIGRQEGGGFDRWLKLWDLISPHLHRCSHISIKLDDCPTEWFWSTIKSVELPELTAFSFVDERNSHALGCEADMEVEDIPWPSVPLKTLCFEGTKRFVFPPITCPTIHSLRFACPTSVGWMASQTLARYPSIRELDLTFTEYSGSDDKTSPPSISAIDLPYLSNMTISNPYPLITVNTPSLSHLTLSFIKPHNWNYFRETKSADFPFPKGWRAPLSLTSFTLHACAFCLHDISTVVATFNSLPHVTTFRLDSCEGQILLFALLDASRDSSSGPDGQNLAYREPPRSADAIPDLIKMQCGCFPRLESLIVANCTGPRPILYEELRFQRPHLEIRVM